VTVSVPATGGTGSFLFGPPALHVDPGTTVTWEWTGSGSHTVRSADGLFDSGQPVGGSNHTFDHTFTETGIYRYYCLPHATLGMRGAIVVGDHLQRPSRDNGRPDLDGYLDDANGFSGTIPDMQRKPSATVAVGAGDGFAFDPAIVHIPTGGAVTFRWTGKGGAHNINGTNGRLDSGDPVEETGPQVSFLLQNDGIYPYYCDNHRDRGMKGAVIVGDDYPT
jgi:halocyanin-like protein